jgi:hypothetical protein
METKEKLTCNKCGHLGYDINRGTGERVPMCNCFPIYRIIKCVWSQPEWCPRIDNTISDEIIKPKEE